MNFFKKSKLLLLLVSASLIFSSCGKQADLSLEADAETYNTGAEMRIEDLKAEPKKESQKKIAEADMETIEPPEDGWTLEELNQVLYMNGQKIELPLMFSSLKEGYEIRNRKYNDKDSLDYNIVGGELYYNNELLAVVSFYELANDLEIISLFLLPILYIDSQDTTEYIHINGFGLKSKISDIYDTLGNGYIYESERFIYNVKNSNFSISIPNLEEDFSIIIKKNKEEFIEND